MKLCLQETVISNIYNERIVRSTAEQTETCTAVIAQLGER